MKKIIATMILAGTFLIVSAQIPRHIPTNGLVGYWPFNGNGNDISGNGNNGTVNGATLTTDRFGKTASAYNFYDTATIFGSCNSFPSGNSQRSISIWYNASNIDSNATQLFGYGGGICGQSFIMNFNNYDIPRGRYEVQGHCNAFKNYANTPSPFNNVWHNIIVTYDGSILKFYNNGNLVASSSNLTINTAINSKLFIFGKEVRPDGMGEYIDNGWPGFKGKLDDIAIWNRALTQAEITRVFVGCPDTVTSQPLNLTGLKGTSKAFTYSYSGSGHNYQWQSNAAELGWQNVTNESQYLGSNTNTLTINNITVSNHNQKFRAIASKSGCIDTSNILILKISDIAKDSADLVNAKDSITKLNQLLANKHDTLYIGSNITTDTLIISIRTGLSVNSPSFNKIKVYPNPAATTLNIELDKPGDYIAKLSGIVGQTIVTPTSGSIDISSLANGVYILTLFDLNNKLISTNKISIIK